MQATLIAVILTAVSVFGASGARLTIGGPVSLRQLHQSTRCPPGCAEGACIIDSRLGGYRCTRCVNTLVTNDSDGRCSCPPGRYAKNGSLDCSDCSKGSYCVGGSFTLEGLVPQKAECGADLTTLGKRATSVQACVNVPGTSYAASSSGAPSATACPADMYSPGMKKQRACMPCPPGYTTNGALRQQRVQSCVVTQGFFLKGPGQVAPCPRGEWKAGYAADSGCQRCPVGTTTPSVASASATDCQVVLPGWYPSLLASDGSTTYITEAQKCPQKFYCEGGVPIEAFDTSTPEALDGTTVKSCPYQTWTEGIGATSSNQCMTPPGFSTNATTGQTTPCGDGEYRAEWRVPTAASHCSVCGSGIYSSTNDQIWGYAITPDANQTAVDVRASAAACCKCRAGASC